jgi:hypothetical protein
MSDFKIIYSNKKLDTQCWDDNPIDTYFMSTNWHKVVISFYVNTFLTKLLAKPVYFYANFGVESWVSGFFYVSRTLKGTIITFGHLLGPSDYFDLVYSPSVTDEQFLTFIKQVQLDFKAQEIKFVHLKATSKFYLAIAKMPTVVSSSLACVAVTLPQTYDIYFASLSKSVRQNIRTAYNRLTKNDLQFQLEVFEKRDSQKIPWERLKKMYQLRNGFRKEKKYWKSQLYHWLNYGFQVEQDMFDLEATRQTDFTLAVLKINKEIAAYFFGFKNQKTIEINRVVINDEFKFYSPGLLLFNEYIKTAISQLECIDLTVGDEKYKFDLGGKEHFIYTGTVVL